MRTLALALLLFSVPTWAQTPSRTAAAPTSAAPIASDAPTPTGEASAPSAPMSEPRCIKSAARGEATLATIELEAICDNANSAALEARVTAVCSAEEAAQFRDAKAQVCVVFPQIGATPQLDILASVYRATTPQLPSPPSSYGRELVPARDDGATQQGIDATMAAQAVSSFLVNRAEKEVSAFATVELFSRLCSADTRTILPKTCELLAGQDNGATPVGLGLLNRTITSDLETLPQNLLKTAFARIKKEKADSGASPELTNATTSLCVVDVGAALARALRAGRLLSDVFTNPADVGLGVLKSYAVLANEPECAPTWQALRTSGDRVNEVKVALEALDEAIDDLRQAQSSEEKTARRIEVAHKSADLLKVLDPTTESEVKRRNQRLFDELSDLSASLWNRDWVGVVAASASAETLGPLLLCKNPESGCKRDEKIRLLLSVSADIAVAKSSDDVQGALNRIVEPVGTWRRKFQDIVTFNLQGYVGGKFAYENVLGATPPGTAIAPLIAAGLEVSFSYSATGRLAVFSQVLDVGNVASIHLAGKDETNLTQVEVAPDIKIVQLFSPGAYAIWTPAKMPFVLGLGFNWTPALRQTPDGLRSAWQTGAFLAVDVPVLELVHE